MFVNPGANCNKRNPKISNATLTLARGCFTKGILNMTLPSKHITV